MNDRPGSGRIGIWLKTDPPVKTDPARKKELYPFFRASYFVKEQAGFRLRQKIPYLPASGRISQFSQRRSLDLADALASDLKALSHLL